MQSIFKCGDIKNNSPDPDKELNMSICGTLSYVITHRSYNLVNMDLIEQGLTSHQTPYIVDGFLRVK